MRLSTTESAQVVLDRLRAAEPRRPTKIDKQNGQLHVDPTFESRHAAWRASIEREEARLIAEKEGRLEAHLEGLRANQDRAWRATKKAERVERAAIKKLAATVIPKKKKAKRK